LSLLPRRSRTSASALPYVSAAAELVTLQGGGCLVAYRVVAPIANLPRLPVDLLTLYHLRRRGAFPEPLRGGPPAVTAYLDAYHGKPRTTVVDEVVLTLRARTRQEALTLRGQYRDPALEPMSGYGLLSFLRRATTFSPEDPNFEGVTALADAIVPFEVEARRGPLATSAVYPQRLAMIVATEPPAETEPALLRHLLARPEPVLVTAHWSPEPLTATAAATRAALRHQRAGGQESLADEEARELTRELFAGNRQAGPLSITLTVPYGDANALQSVAVPRTTWENSTGWLCREPGIDSAAAFLSQYHRPELVSHRPRVTSRTFLDLVTLRQTLPEAEAFAHFDGTAHEVQPFSPYIDDVGHSLIVGPTGTGKSVFLGHLTMAALSAGLQVTLFDQHQGFTKLSRHVGGATTLCAHDAPLDNPFRRPLTRPLARWWDVFLCATVPEASSALRAEALRILYEQPEDQRDFGVILDLMAHAGVDISELLPWYDGDREAVFHPANDLLPEAPHVEHYDLTQVYAEPLILSYLTTRVMDQLGVGRRLLVFDEAWAAFETDYLRAFLASGLRTARKLGGAFLFAAQRPQDFHGWHENILTRVFLPNPNLTLEDAQAIAPVTEPFVDAVRAAIPRRDYVVSRGTHWATLRLDLADASELLDLHKPPTGGPRVLHIA